MLALSNLFLEGRHIQDIAGLEYAANLQVLMLGHNQIRDISALSALSHLETLWANWNQFGDLGPLSGLTGLKTLILHENPIHDLSPLSGLTNLQELDLNRTQVSEVSPLLGLTSLKRLWLMETSLNQDAHCHDLRAIVQNNPGIELAYWPTNVPPTDLSASDGTSSNKVHIAWSPVCNGPHFTSTYRVSRGLSVNGAKVPVSGWQTSTFFDDRTAEPGTQYVYWVQTDATWGVGDYSAPETGWRSPMETLHVDDDAPNDPLPFTTVISDPCEDGTPQHPFDSIQEALDAAPDGATVLVYDGTYRERLVFPGRNVTVTGLDPSAQRVPRPYPVIDANQTGTAVSFIHGEDANCILEGLLVTGGASDLAGAIYCKDSSPTILNCILAGNRAFDPNAGGGAICCVDSNAIFAHCTVTGNQGGTDAAGVTLLNSKATFSNSILWGNTPREVLVVGTGVPSVTYTAIAGGWLGSGNIDSDPLFAEAGRWTDYSSPDGPPGPAADPSFCLDQETGEAEGCLRGDWEGVKSPTV